MAAESKVFDIANPGSSRPDTGSKPMVVGHKNLLDPTLKGPVESESASSDPLAARREKTLTPMSDSKSEKTKQEVVIVSDEKPEIALSTTAPAEEEPVTEDEPATTPEPEEEPAVEIPEQTPESKQKAEADQEIERSEKLQEMIRNKTYNAPIHEASMLSLQTFFKTFIIVAVVGIFALIILVDA